MSGSKIQKLIEADLARFRLEVEAHLSEFPMGASYFGMQAARNPQLVGRLRKGLGFKPDTIQKVRTYISARKGKLSGGVQ